ncbi:hypothetical protein HYT33_02205 [Candidatus Roizmanbacteria bacterium]|nr:hypothetical protein [Candidatus Roizmanbacteria bacterium]
MAIKFPVNFFQTRGDTEELYLGLFLKEQEGAVFYIEEKGGSLHIIANERFAYTNGWDNLVEDIDEALYKLETETRKSPEKTIFFLYAHVIDAHAKEIKKPYLHKIKELTKNLELKPLGYIECHEGIVEYLEKKEGLSLTATLIEFDKATLGIFVYKGGKIIFQEAVPRSLNLIDDLTPIFEKIKTISVLPARIILYDSKDLDVESGQLLTRGWEQEFFPQPPKVEIVREEQLIEGLLKIFVSQIMPEKKEEPKEKEVMGFVIGADVAPKKEADLPKQEQPMVSKPAFNYDVTFAKGILSNFISWFKQLGSLFSKTRNISVPLLAVIGSLFIILAVFLMEYYFHTAEVTVFFPSQRLVKDVVVSGNSSSNAGKNDLRVHIGTTQQQFNETKPSLGKRDVGEKAKGDVTIHNFDDRERVFEKGTTLAAQGIKFVLEDDVKVASSSLASDGSAKLPGKGKGGIEAVEIGSEANLSKNQRFQIADLSASLYFALNEANLSGGSKKSIKTVSKDDHEALRKKILEKAGEFGKKNIEPKLQKDSKLLQQLTGIELRNLQYSKEVGEEADEVALKATAKITHHSYKDRELRNRFAEALSREIKKSFQLDVDGISYVIRKVQKDKEDYKIQANVKAKQVRKVSKDEIVSNLSNKKSDDVEKLVREKYKASGLELKVNHPLPFLRNRLPLFKKNVDLEISYL